MRHDPRPSSPDTVRALAICRTCTVRQPCLAEALTYPGNADPGIRGKTLSYTVTLKGLKERDTLPLDDDFAKSVADLMVFMDQGEIVEANPPAEFFANPRSERTKLFLSQILSH
jgi:ABC-type histidine transport system ATPase subunit